jgi:hypothetical protein
MGRENVVASLTAAEQALGHFAASLDHAGFGAGADAYRRMASILLGQWVWLADQPERELDPRFIRIADLAESIALQLRPYVETMERLVALRGLVAERHGVAQPSDTSRILEALVAADRPLSVMEIRAATREPTTTIRRELARLMDLGQVVLAGGARPRYGLPEQG